MSFTKLSKNIGHSKEDQKNLSQPKQHNKSDLFNQLHTCLFLTISTGNPAKIIKTPKPIKKFDINALLSYSQRG